MKTNQADLPIQEHLGELRVRIFYSIISIIVLSLISLNFSDFFFNIIKQPFLEGFKNYLLIGTSPGEAFVLKLKLAFFCGIITSSPILFYQVWKFISPALEDHEKKWAIPFLTVTTLFFLGGVLFAYKIILPIALKFFAEEYASMGVEPNIKIDEYFSLVIQGLLVFGGIFELPLFFFILAKLKLVKSQSLIKYWRHSITGIFIISAILTPPDVFSQCLMAFPMMILYVISIAVVKLANE